MVKKKIAASFRDPAGFVYQHNGELLRQINRSYAYNYELLQSSGLYEALVEREWMVAHEELAPNDHGDTDPDHYKTIKPMLVPYISYPYEWCFSQLRDAALLTLSIQSLALRHGMTLKDASAYNVQFIGSSPVFIDTLSFEAFREGQPWVAYRQFCQHFLGPLAVMASCDVRLRHLLKSFVDGLPLDVVSRLLPRRTLARYGLLAHIHLHAVSQKRHQHDARKSDASPRKANMTLTMHTALIESLRKAVQKCRLPKVGTEWEHYYEDTNYSSGGMSSKEQLVVGLLQAHTDPGDLIHDLGGNTGRFGRLAAASGRYVVSHDIDEMAVEKNYRINCDAGVDNVLPLMLNLNNPAPRLGWALEERLSLLDRVESKMVMALALIHHVVISNNVPIGEFARFLAQIAHTLIIEFVPKEDSQVRRLLATREDIFPFYDIEHFEAEFLNHFSIIERKKIDDTARTLYVMRRKLLEEMG